MKIWEAIIYGILGGLTELLPISFSGHNAVLREILGLSSLQEGGGYYIRAAICLGVMLAITLAFAGEVRASFRTLRTLGRRPHRGRRPDAANAARRRSVLLGGFALLPMLLSFLFLAGAERVTRLPYIALLFVLNGVLLFFCCRRSAGRKTEAGVLLQDTLLIGAARMLSVFPGLSSLGSSISVGNVRGLSSQYNLRLAYLLTLAFEAAAFFFYFIRAFLYGSFSGGILLGMLLALIFAAVCGYLAIQYLRYLLNRGKLHVFSYYCWDAAVVVLILSLINS